MGWRMTTGIHDGSRRLIASALIRLPGCCPVHIEFNCMHWFRGGTKHGPRSNPRFLAASWLKLDISPPSSGRRLWIYVRGGYACFFDVSINRRENGT